MFAGLLLPAGALGDRFGRKGALVVGLVIFGGAALAASQANDPSQLIAVRTLMGVGAALIMPATLSIILNSFPMHERPKAIALWAAFAGVGGALGPITSGVLLEHYWWGSVFMVCIPIVVLADRAHRAVRPTSRDPGHTALDPIGAVLSVVALVGLVFAVIEGPELGWTAPATLAGFAAFVVGGALFVRYELSISNPMLDPRLFRVRPFSTGSGAITTIFLCTFGMFFLMTQFFQFVQGYSPLESGIRQLPYAITLIAIAPRGPKIISRFGVRRVVRVGFWIGAAAFALALHDRRRRRVLDRPGVAGSRSRPARRWSCPRRVSSSSARAAVQVGRRLRRERRDPRGGRGAWHRGARQRHCVRVPLGDGGAHGGVTARGRRHRR